jgi:predicted transcriptional regulator
MKTVTVRADGFEGWVKRGRERVRRIARKEKIEPEMTINFESPLEMLECLSPERMRLFAATKARACSMSELAAELKRDPKSVRRDVQKLERAGVLRAREAINPGHGRVKIVEPVAERFELRASF